MTGRAAWAALAVAAVAALIVPWDALDPASARLFYRPEFPHGPWQTPRLIPWGVVAHLTPVVALGLALFGLVRLVRPRSRDASARDRRAAIVLLLGLALGPGLLVNLILKDHWHRPRPRQTIGLGGDFPYVAPFRIGPVGKSFPCGHSAVGFACVALAGFVDARRRRARLAVVAGALALGTLLGLGRVATGAHFASDVIWSALLTCVTIAAVAVAVERRAARARSAGSAAVKAGVRGRTLAAGLVAAAALASALLCFPFRDVEAPHAIPLPEALATLEVRVEIQHARLVFLPPGPAELTVESRHDGFGVPWGRVEEQVDRVPTSDVSSSPVVSAGTGATVRYRVASRGWFADLEGTTVVSLPASAAGRVEIDVTDGHLTIIDASDGAALPPIRCRIRPGALRLRGVRPDQLELVER